MTTHEKATAACRAAMAQTNALAWRSAHPFRSKAELLSHARALASIGLKPVPMRSQDKRPACKGWREAASLDLDAITAVFNAAPYADALGVATGGGVFVVDLDRNHGDGADGIASFAALVRKHGAIASGPRVKTPSGGVHLYFRSPPGVHVRSRVALAPGVDVRGEGGVAMVPPSARDGVTYRWAPDPWRQPPVLAPAWLMALAAPPEPPPRPRAPMRPFRGDLHPYAWAALQRECVAVASCVNGTRNATLFKAAASLGALAAGGALPAQSVANALMAAASACGLVADDGIAAVRATLASGLRAGLSRPRALPASTGGRLP